MFILITISSPFWVDASWSKSQNVQIIGDCGDNIQISRSIMDYDYATLMEIGDDYVNSGNELAAILIYSTAISLDEKNSTAYVMRANVLRLLGMPELALGDYDSAIALNTINTPFYLTNQGVTLFELERYEEAIKAFTDAIIRQPEIAQAYYYRGWSWERTGAYRYANADFAQALFWDPDCVTNFIELGVYHYDNGDFDAALEYFNHAVATLYEPQDALMHRGLIYVQQGKFEEALRDFSTVLSRDSTYWQANYGLASLYFHTGRFKDALENYQRYLLLSGDYSNEFVIERIGELRAAIELDS